MDPNHRTAGKIAKVPDLSRRESNHTHTNPEASKGEVARERAEKRGQNQTQTQRDPTPRRKRRGQEAATDRRRNGTQEPERVLRRLIERPIGVLEHQGEYLCAAEVWIPDCVMVRAPLLTPQGGMLTYAWPNSFISTNTV